MMQYKVVLKLFQKITSATLCKPIHDIISYSTFICPFESGKCGTEAKKLQKFKYLKNEKSFLDEINSIFYSFGEKKKKIVSKSIFAIRKKLK